MKRVISKIINKSNYPQTFSINSKLIVDNTQMVEDFNHLFSNIIRPYIREVTDQS